MKAGNFKLLVFLTILFFNSSTFLHTADEIKSVPLINLEDLSPTFEEGNDELEKNEQKNSYLKKEEKIMEGSSNEDKDKIYINITALDKITAKTSSLRLAVGEKKFFGPLEIKALKCQFSENNDATDIVAYLQVKDLSIIDNNRVFLFNGWTFASSPTLESIDHPVYDLWITNCENI